MSQGDKSKLHRVPLSILLLSLLSLSLALIPQAHAATLVQTKVATCTGSTCAVTPDNALASGNSLVLTLVAYTNNASCETVTVNSSPSFSWSTTVTTSASNAGECVASYSFYATIASSGSNTITATITNGCSCTRAIMEVAHEVQGITSSGATSASNSGTAGSFTSFATSSSVSFSSTPFIVSIAGTWGISGGSGFSAGSGFTLLSCAGYTVCNEEYAASGMSSPTSFPMTASSGATNYVYVGAQYPQVAQTEQVTLTVSPNGSPAGTFTITGCNPSVSTISADGSMHSFTADVNCLITITVPADTASNVYRFNGGSLTWSWTTAGGGTEAKSNTVYYEDKLTVSYSVQGGGSPTAPTFTYVSLGVSSTTYTMTTTPTVKLVDDGTSWTVTPNPLTESGSSERWKAASGTFGTASGGASVAVAYYHQYILLNTNSCNGFSTSPSSETSDTWFKSGDSISITCNGIWGRSGGTGIRAISYNFDGGTNTNEATLGTFTTSALVVSASHTLNVNPATQYQVTLDAGATASLGSCKPTITGDACWYDSGTTGEVDLQAVYGRSGGTGNRLASWKLDSGASVSVLQTSLVVISIPAMGAPHSVTTASVIQHQVTPGQGLSLSAPTVQGDSGWYDVNQQVTITGQYVAVYVVSSPLWASQVSSYGMQLVTNRSASTILFQSLDLSYGCAKCSSKVFVPPQSNLNVQTVSGDLRNVAFTTQGSITSFSSSASSIVVFFGSSVTVPPAASTTTTSSSTQTDSGGLFQNPDYTSYIEYGAIVAAGVAAVALGVTGRGKKALGSLRKL